MRKWRSVVVFLATVVGVSVTVSAGIWQLGRADQKIAIHEAMLARQAQPPLRNADLPCDASDWVQAEQRHVALHGTWLDRHTVFLDNRAMDGRAGFLVLTPLQLDAAPSVPGRAPCGAQAVLVQRGWVPRDLRDRTRLPEVPTPAGEALLVGRLVPAPSKLMELGAASAPTGRLRQNVDVHELSQEWRLALRPGSVQQLQPQAGAANQEGGVSARMGGIPGADVDGLLRHWWQPSADVGKHQAYAAQWFAMATVMVALHLWFQWLKPLRLRGPRSA